MNEQQNNNQNGAANEQPVEQENKRNWKQIAANWGRRILWAGIGVGATLGIQALKNRKKNRQA